MTVTKLNTRRVAKPWGREELWGPFTGDGERVGEIWYQDPAGRDLPLLIKYLFTSEKLSIQVHPDDTAAQAIGQPRGKDEAWVILGAEPQSTIALGPKVTTSREELRAAALDGGIEELLDWRPVKAGDVIYSRAGTVHAIGAGLTLIEVQQNSDTTYRLYDYSRPRELHLDEGIPLSDSVPFVAPPVPGRIEPGRELLVGDGAKFTLERWTGAGERRIEVGEEPTWLVQVAGESELNGHKVAAGECWLVEGDAKLTQDRGCELLLARPKQQAYS